jgi:hypothetical protein
MPSTLRSQVPLFVLMLSLAACETPPSREPAPQELPRIQSSATRDGRGIPNGRSDAARPFIRASMEVSTDRSYGYSKDNPIKVGPRSPSLLHIQYLNSLRGPGGEPVEYERKGACCEFATRNSEFGGGLLDVYRVKVDGKEKDVFLFVNMYDPGPPKIPAGFTQRRQ